MSKSKGEKKKKKKGFLVKLIWLGFLGPIIGLSIALLIVGLTSLPSIKELDNPKSNLATQVFTSDHVVLGKYFKQNRTNVEYNQLSPHLVDALIATEDERFHGHSGVDAEALARAVARMGSGGGGSTITQQVAKMQFHKRAKSKLGRLKQKLGEWIIAVRLEKKFTKEEIIALYFNQYDFLNNAVGINSAARVYFNKTPEELNIQESAMLVGMAKNSSLFNPIKRPEKVHKRREVVLKQMKKNGYLNQAQYDSIRVLPLGLSYTKVDHKSGMAPYFREMLRGELKNILSKEVNGKPKYYNKEQDRPYNLYTDGLRVYTTIDSRMQKYAEWSVKEHLGKKLQRTLDKKIDEKNNSWSGFSKRPPFRNRIKEDVVERILTSAKKQTMLYKKLSGKICGVCERPGTKKKKVKGKESYICNYASSHVEPSYNEEEIDSILNVPTLTQVFDWDSENYEKDTTLSPMDVIRYHKRFLRSSLMSMDPRSGHIKAWVGGPDFKYFQYDMVKKGKRQVGSTFKPFVYATAMQYGKITPCEEIPNIEQCVDYMKGNRTAQWCPRNSGVPFSSDMVSFKYGLAASMNNITAEVIDRIEPENVIENIVKTGIPKEDIQAVPSIALGVFDVSLYNMVGFINVFANKGVYVEPVFITRIEDKKGNLIYESEPKTEQIFDPYTSYTMIQMMKGVVDGIPHKTMKTKRGNRRVGGTSMRLRFNRPYGGLKNPIAGKTGTTNNNTDGWFLGLTPDLVTGVWTGCEDNAVSFYSTANGSGTNMSLPIWGYYMNKIYDDSTINVSKGDFDKPDNHVDVYSNCGGDDDSSPIDYNNFSIDDEDYSGGGMSD